MRQPKGRRFRKQSKRKAHATEAGARREYGTVGRRSTERGRISARQRETVRRTVRHHLSRAGQVWLRVFPDVPVTKKPIEVRMGKGKGSVEWWGVKVRPGRRRIEVGGVSTELATAALTKAGRKRSIHTAITVREGGV